MSDIAKLKKALADMDARLVDMQKRIDNTCDALDKKYETLVESMKSISGVQTHAILHQIRSEMQMEMQRMQRDLTRDANGSLRY